MKLFRRLNGAVSRNLRTVEIAWVVVSGRGPGG